MYVVPSVVLFFCKRTETKKTRKKKVFVTVPATKPPLPMFSRSASLWVEDALPASSHLAVRLERWLPNKRVDSRIHQHGQKFP